MLEAVGGKLGGEKGREEFGHNGDRVVQAGVDRNKDSGVAQGILPNEDRNPLMVHFNNNVIFLP